MKRISNVYTLVYALVLVIVVGVGLSLVFQWLRPAQERNIADDTKAQILRSARIETSGNVSETFRRHILRAYLVNYHGTIIDRNPEAAFAASLDMGNQSRIPAEKRKLPVFECRTGNGVKYILPVYGAGLWGPIWGYVAFDSDGSTIYGAYFAHQGETPGLGAEIEKPKFSDQFEGKSIFEHGRFTSVTVCKPGREPKSGAWVHGVSGGTITSQGVGTMLRESLEPYSAYLRSLSR